MPAIILFFFDMASRKELLQNATPQIASLSETLNESRSFEVLKFSRYGTEDAIQSVMNSSISQLKALQARFHPFCLVCSGSNPYGLGLAFAPGGNGELHATFNANAGLEGYEGLLHGGMTASLLDGVMTNCLFMHGVTALTAELKVRYREPVKIGPEVTLCARIERKHPPLYLMAAELIQEGCVRATASAKFMEHHEP